MMRKTGFKKKKDFKRSTYVDTLDAVVSHFVRQNAANDNGFAKCYTCETVQPWQALQCGHYFGRTAFSTRWDTDRNLRTQCANCNIWRKGNYPVYGVLLAQEIGAEEMEKLMQDNHKTVKLSNADLLEMIADYYSRLRWKEQISKDLRAKLKQLKVI